MGEHRLQDQFTEEFFEEFMFDPEFRSIFRAMEGGMSPYNVIEYLCRSKCDLMSALKETIENTPQRIVVTTETLQELKKQNKP